jgi:two-component system, chemotaxis family, sensor kinase Cph1
MTNDNSSSQPPLLEEIQQFLQSAVHDLRAANRRTAIAAEIVRESPNDPERDELTAQILQGISKAESLLTAISSYSAALVPSRYNIGVFPSNQAVRFALANLDGKIRETGAVVAVADLPEINGDRDRLAEVFGQLISNSLKFRGPDAPRIGIDASRIPEGWLFSVTDNGIGIPLKYQHRIFIPFRRLCGADIEGTGLGLAISRKIIEAHGGRIWIEGEEGPGLIVKFVLPAADGD